MSVSNYMGNAFPIMLIMNIMVSIKVVICSDGKEPKLFCIYYEIKQGDTLYSISRRYNVDLNAIIMANPFINVYNLRVGDVICLPCVPQNRYMNYTTYMVEDGDTLGSIIEKTGVNLADLMEVNDINSISLMPGTTVIVPLTEDGV